MSARGARRRLATVEDQLAPSRVILRWLAEAKAHGSMAAYTDALAEGPGALEPFERFLALLEQAVDRSVLAGSSPESTQARRRATRQAIFRFCLVLRLSQHAIRWGPLRTVTAAANSYHLDALLAGQPNTGGSGEVNADTGWRTWQDRGEHLLIELYADRFARLSLEARFLEGAGSLMPDAERDYSTALDLSEATVKAGLRARAAPGHDPLSAFRETTLDRIIDGALVQASELAVAIIAGAMADLREVDRAAISHPWPALGLCQPPER